MVINISELNMAIYVSIFIALFLFCYGLSNFVKQRSAKREIIRKIKRKHEAFAIAAEESFDINEGVKGFSKIFDALGNLAKSILPSLSQANSVKRLRFLRAGIRKENANASFWGAKIFLMILLTLCFFILRFWYFKILSYQATLIIGVFTALLGFYIPDIWLRQKADKRKEKVLQALPDALDLLIISVEAGMGLDTAILRVANEMKLSSPELSDELHFMNLELRAGKSRREALKNLALRTNLEEIKSLTTLLIQTDQFGTSMADALRVYSDSFRTERFQRAEELAAKLPVKLLFPLVAFIFPALFVVLLGPAAISIYNAFLKQ
jgi:tight adherence protein C